MIIPYQNAHELSKIIKKDIYKKKVYVTEKKYLNGGHSERFISGQWTSQNLIKKKKINKECDLIE